MKAIIDQLASDKKALESGFRRLKEHAKMLIGLDCTILRGHFKGRRARITQVTTDVEGNVKVLARPYRIARFEFEGELLWNHPDARTYWHLSDIANARRDRDVR